MKLTRFSEDQIVCVGKDGEASAKTGGFARRCAVLETTIYNWKAKYGGRKLSKANHLCALEDKNGGLKRLLADAMLDAAIVFAITSPLRTKNRMNGDCHSGHSIPKF